MSKKYQKWPDTTSGWSTQFVISPSYILVRISYPKAPGKNEFSENLNESGHKSNPGPETVTVIIYDIAQKEPHHVVQITFSV